jgi:hypothetical protein
LQRHYKVCARREEEGLKIDGTKKKNGCVGEGLCCDVFFFFFFFFFFGYFLINSNSSQLIQTDPCLLLDRSIPTLLPLTETGEPIPHGYKGADDVRHKTALSTWWK